MSDKRYEKKISNRTCLGCDKPLPPDWEGNLCEHCKEVMMALANAMKKAGLTFTRIEFR